MELHQQYNTVLSYFQFRLSAHVGLRSWYLILGYGGFSIPINPFFSVTFLTLAQRYGFILAVPNIRGGGEFGEAWHLAGCLEKKVRCSEPLYFITRLEKEFKQENSFDDFISAT